MEKFCMWPKVVPKTWCAPKAHRARRTPKHPFLEQLIYAPPPIVPSHINIQTNQEFKCLQNYLKLLLYVFDTLKLDFHGTISPMNPWRIFLLKKLSNIQLPRNLEVKLKTKNTPKELKAFFWANQAKSFLIVSKCTQSEILNGVFKYFTESA